MKKFTNKKGFTLVEMMLVVGIITLLSGVVITASVADYTRFREGVMRDGDFESGASYVAEDPVLNDEAFEAPVVLSEETQNFIDNLAGTSETFSLRWHNDNGRHNGFSNSNHSGYTGTNIKNLEDPISNYYYWGEPVIETIVTIPSGITCTEYEVVIEYAGEIEEVRNCRNADYEIEGNRIRLTTSNQNPGEIGIEVSVSGGESEVRSVVAVGYNTNNGRGNGRR